MDQWRRLLGFGLSILFGGPLCDILGMATLLRLAALGHIGGTLLTLVAPNFTALFAATVIHRIATPRRSGRQSAGHHHLRQGQDRQADRAPRVVPRGIVIGGVLCFIFTQIGWAGRPRCCLMLIPSAIYATLFFGATFPATERQAAGVSNSDMFGEVLRPPLSAHLPVHVADGGHRAGAGSGWRTSSTT